MRELLDQSDVLEGRRPARSSRKDVAVVRDGRASCVCEWKIVVVRHGFMPPARCNSRGTFADGKKAELQVTRRFDDADCLAANRPLLLSNLSDGSACEQVTTNKSVLRQTLSRHACRAND